MSEPQNAFVTGLIGERIAGRYIVERVLRAGGMGVVALGRYPELEQEVAIKFMKPEYAAHTVLCARFLREARLAARVKSPHFVRVFDFGRVEPGVPYLVMEMLTGNDLADEIENKGAMAIPVAVDYLLQACVALAEVHGLGIVHRDLKPSNLFLAEAGGTRMLKVLDFGVSKESVGESLTSTGSPVGTPHYMSPEQVKESKLVDVRSDVWSLGVILYELLTTTIPFGGDGEPIGEVYGMIMHTEPKPPRHYAPELPAEIEAVILKCLRRDPKERYATVGELAEALRPFASAGSIARIEAVQQVLAFERPERALGGDSPVLEVALPPLEKVSSSSRAVSPVRDEKATSASAPNAKRSDGGKITTDDGPRRARPDTAMTSTRSSETPELLRMPTPAPKTSPMVRIGLAAFVAGIGIAVIVFWRSTTSIPPAQSSAASASAPVIAPSTSATSAPIVAEPIAKPIPSASASAPAPIVSAVPSAPPAPTPPTHRRTTPPASQPKPAPASPPSDLLNDRK